MKTRTCVWNQEYVYGNENMHTETRVCIMKREYSIEGTSGTQIRITRGGRGLRRGTGKRVDRMFPGRPQSFRHQRQAVDYDHIMTAAQEGGEWRRMAEQEAERFMAKWIAAEERQCWSTTCSSMLERDGKGQGEDSPKQAGSCWFARPC